ncbi:uncharacterized protein EHS24_007166 [Apiotrichum porosum]|uniref:Uncharacterized protein n=1 Tax=Apiotrichum porosum TaxID=105984 RepID=A0A427XXB8_9TREE|nr:uncharacterized protein EHS24_007166 [Apiotrichum porosum]RSH83480.1 hypothetical protein EHS24_007166 [Apiotrichum porosum]
MGILRKRTSKANLKAKEDRAPTPPPQLPPLPDHIRRAQAAKAASNAANAQAQIPAANRRRSKSLWANSDEARDAARAVTPISRRGSIGSTASGAAQPWRSREAWLALHAPPEPPSILSALTFPCAQEELPPGWRGRGGGGFFGAEGMMTESEMVRRADAELRSDIKKDAPYSPRRTPGSPRSARRVFAAQQQEPPVSNITPRRLDFEQAATTPRTAGGLGLSSASDSASTGSTGSGSPPSFISLAPSSTAAVPITPRPRRTQEDANTHTPPETVASPGTPNVLMTPNAAVVPTLADARNMWGAQAQPRAASPLQRAGQLVHLGIRYWICRNGQLSDDGHGRVERVMEHRASLPTDRGAGDVAGRDRAAEVIDFTRSPPVAGAHHHAAPVSRIPQPVRQASLPQQQQSAAHQFPAPPPSAMVLPSQQNLGGSRPPSRNTSNGSQRPSSRQAVDRPPSRQAAAEQRAPSRQASYGDRSAASRPASRQQFMDRLDRPPSRGASSTGHSADGRHVPHTPAAIADAVTAWRQRSKREANEEPFMPGPGASRSRTPSNAEQFMPGPGHGHGYEPPRKEIPRDWPTEELEHDPFAPVSHHGSQHGHAWEAAYDYEDEEDDFRPPTRLPQMGMPVQQQHHLPQQQHHYQPQQHHAHGHHGQHNMAHMQHMQHVQHVPRQMQMQHAQPQPMHGGYQAHTQQAHVPHGVPGGIMQMAPGVPMGKVPMQVPQMQKSPRVQQSVAQGGWI